MPNNSLPDDVRSYSYESPRQAGRARSPHEARGRQSLCRIGCHGRFTDAAWRGVFFSERDGKQYKEVR